MSVIPFTDRELKRAWRELMKISGSEGTRTNAHRLLLFYAIECGLKTVWLKRNNRLLFDHDDIAQIGHDLRQILKDLRLGQEYDLPQNLQLSPVYQHGKPIPRNGNISILHQVWRYGGQCCQPTDQDCEKSLEHMLIWIAKELT